MRENDARLTIVSLHRSAGLKKDDLGARRRESLAPQHKVRSPWGLKCRILHISNASTQKTPSQSHKIRQNDARLTIVSLPRSAGSIAYYGAFFPSPWFVCVSGCAMDTAMEPALLELYNNVVGTLAPEAQELFDGKQSRSSLRSQPRSPRARSRRVPSAASANRQRAYCARAPSACSASSTIRPSASASSAVRRRRCRTRLSHGPARSASRRAKRCSRRRCSGQPRSAGAEASLL